MKIILSITMIMILLSYTVAKTADEERCGSQAGGQTCSDYKCCSVYGYCGTEAEYCLPDNYCQSNCWSGPSGLNVSAFWTKLNPEQHNWDLKAVGVECATLDGDKPYEWRSKYNWTGFCGPNFPPGKDVCGMCLRVTNIRTNAIAKVRIVDTCGTGGLDLDITPFNGLDTDGHGNEQGHLDVDYQFISCDDEVSGHPNFKNILGSVVNNV